MKLVSRPSDSYPDFLKTLSEAHIAAAASSVSHGLLNITVFTEFFYAM